MESAGGDLHPAKLLFGSACAHSPRFASLNHLRLPVPPPRFWQGRPDSNRCIPASKSGSFPLGYGPVYCPTGIAPGPPCVGGASFMGQGLSTKENTRLRRSSRRGGSGRTRTCISPGSILPRRAAICATLPYGPACAGHGLLFCAGQQLFPAGITLHLRQQKVGRV